MTGAGSARVAYRPEASQFTADDTATWKQPGMNITVDSLSIDNQQSRNRNPDDVTPAGSRAGTFVGTASLSWDLTDDNWHELIPFSSGSLSGQGGLAPTAEWFFEINALDDTDTQFTEDLTVSGGAIQQASVQWQQGQAVSVSVTVIFGALSSSAPAAGNIQQPVNADIYTHHGTTISVDTRSQTGAQSATLELSNLARRQEQQDRKPLRMLIGAVEPTFETDAVFSQTDQLEAALGGSSDSVADVIAGEPTGTFEHTNGNGGTVSYTLDQLDPQTYDWAGLVDPEADLTEPVTYHVADVSV